MSNRRAGRIFRFAPPVFSAAGALLVLYGSAYPHFLLGESWNTYLYAAPFGLLPCPTLSVAIGVTLMLGMFRSTLWSNTLVAAGVAYGAIGVVRLGVVLDYGLLAGAALLAGAILARVSTASITEEPTRQSPAQTGFH